MLGYTAQRSNLVNIDLGPTIDWTPEGRELRQVYQKGLTAFFNEAQRSHRADPVASLGQGADYQQYFEQMRILAARSPELAATLADEANMVGIMSDRFKGSGLQLEYGRSPLGDSFYVPMLPGPAASMVDYAGAGVPKIGREKAPCSRLDGHEGDCGFGDRAERAMVNAFRATAELRRLEAAGEHIPAEIWQFLIQ
jgi:hypothetical protein